MSKAMFVPKYMIEALILELRNICSELENLNENFRLFVKAYAKYELRGRK